jgi:hypothetical protein
MKSKKIRVEQCRKCLDLGYTRRLYSVTYGTALVGGHHDTWEQAMVVASRYARRQANSALLAVSGVTR